MNNPLHYLYDEDYFQRLHGLNRVGNNKYRERQRMETIDFLCEPNLDDTILEIGCGTGFYTRMLAPRVHHIVGIDFSETAIDKAKLQNKSENVWYVVADAQDLSTFPDNTFDKILAIDVLEHLTDSQLGAAFREVARVMSKRGRFVFFTPSSSHWIEQLKARNVIVKQFPEHVGVRNEAEYDRATAENGLRIRRALRFETCIPMLRHFENRAKDLPWIGALFVSRLGVAAEHSTP
jgi:ubiquinone/menaquinone biosynthesis C-methylase UbiE